MKYICPNRKQCKIEHCFHYKHKSKTCKCQKNGPCPACVPVEDKKQEVKSLLITLEITDPEIVAAYSDVDNEIIFNDMVNGTLWHKTGLVSCKNELRKDER